MFVSPCQGLHWLTRSNCAPCSAAPSGDRAIIGQKAQPTGAKANEEPPSENMGATVRAFFYPFHLYMFCIGTLTCNEAVLWAISAPYHVLFLKASLGLTYFEQNVVCAMHNKRS